MIILFGTNVEHFNDKQHADDDDDDADDGQRK